MWEKNCCDKSKIKQSKAKWSKLFNRFHGSRQEFCNEIVQQVDDSTGLQSWVLKSNVTVVTNATLVSTHGVLLTIFRTTEIPSYP